MKKHLILFIMAVAFILTSCSNDDDADNTDPIIGTWVVVAITPPLIDIGACENRSIISFNANYTGSATFPLPDACEPETTPGTWRNLGGNNYQIQVPILETLTGNAEFNGDDAFTFQTSQGFIISFERLSN